MSHLVRRFLATAALAVVLPGCSTLDSLTSKPFRYDNNHSMAYNISVASGMDPFYDASVSPEVKALFSRTDFDLTYPPPADGTFNQTTTSLTPLLQPWISVGFRQEDWQKTGIIAWIPSDRAPTPEKAAKLLSDEITKAVAAALADMKLEYVISPVSTSDPGIIGKYVFQVEKQHYLKVRFTDPSGGCIMGESGRRVDDPPRCMFFGWFSEPQQLTTTPPFLPQNTSGKSYLVNLTSVNRSYLSMPYNESIQLPEGKMLRMSYSILQRISKHLPAWIIIHLSQRETNGLPALLLQQGKVYFFVKEKQDKS